MISDPGRINLRKAARAAIVTPAVYAVCDLGFDDSTMALFAAFASFAALVFADFGGTLVGRARAYAGLLAAGAILVGAGTLLSRGTLPATIAMLLVGFVVVFVGALGGYVAAAGSATVLSFVLAVMVPAPNSELLARELGWLLGIGAAAVSALILWPFQERREVRVACADLADALGAAMTTGSTHERALLTRASDALRARTGAVFRPAGSATRDRALVALVRELHLAERFLDELPAPAPEDRRLRTAVASTLGEVADALRAPVDRLDVAPLVRARAEHTEMLETWAGTQGAVDSRVVVQRFDAEFPLRAMSLRVLAVAVEASGATGALSVGLDAASDRAPADLRFLAQPAMAATVWHTLAGHLSLRSVRCRAALRAALGLALAVFVAKSFDLDHAFWVVLGTLSVLRSNALGTGVTALESVVGTLLGFAAATVLATVVGGDDLALWIALPIAVFLSAYTPGAVHFVVGQASFTIFVVVLFNLIEPQGWRTGLVRLEDIAIGVGISLVVGVLLWPRGARRVTVATFSDLLRAAGRYAARAIASVVDQEQGDPEREAMIERAHAVAARERAISAFEDLSVERGGGHVDRDAWVSLLALSSTLLLAGDGLTRLAVGSREPGCDAARAELARFGTAVDRSLAALVEHLGDTPRGEPLPVDTSHVDGLCACVDERARDGGGAPITLLWAREFLVLVERRLASLDEPY